MVVGEVPSLVKIPLDRNREGLGWSERAYEDGEGGEGNDVQEFCGHP